MRPYVGSHREELDDLQRELHSTRRDMVRMMPERYADLLSSYDECDDRPAAYQWVNGVADQIVADVPPGPSSSYEGPRAACPLCRSTGGSLYEWGYKLPRGLHRHLVGHGTTRECPVVRAALELARESWDLRFSAREEEARLERQASLERRRASETLFRLDPREKPVLVDQGLRGASARGSEGLEWATSRLEELGFHVREEERVRSFVEEQSAYIVYADPRAEGEITFRFFQKTLSGNLSNARGARRSFFIKDIWKNDLPGKYRARVAKALR